MLLQMAAGAGAGAITKTAVAPLERLKILFQVQDMSEATKRKYTSIRQALGLVVQEEGIGGLYKGNGANVLRVIPVYALKFAFNDTFKALVGGKDADTMGFSQLMLSGSLAGLNQQLITYPLEVIRTRLSLSGMGLMSDQYTGIANCAVTIVRKEGIAGLYKGIGPTILSGAPYVGLQMTFYELFGRAMPHDERGKVGLKYSLMAGAFAGLIAQTITFPGDVIRRRMQTNGAGGAARLYTTSMDCLRKTVSNEGVLALYKGLSTNVVRCLPGAAIQFAAYDMLKGALGVGKK